MSGVDTLGNSGRWEAPQTISARWTWTAARQDLDPHLAYTGRPRDGGDVEYVRADLYRGAVRALGDAIQLLEGCRDGDAVDARALLKAAYAKYGGQSS